MKKITFILIVAMMTLISFSSAAQIKFGVKGGVNISKIHFNDDIVKSSNLTGFQVGPMMEVMAPYLGIGVDAAILYSQKGIEVDNESINADYLDIPINFKWKFGLPIVKGYLAAGPYFGLRVGGDKTWEIQHQEIKTKGFGTGLNIGAGIEAIRHLQVGVNYNFGLTDNYEGVGNLLVNGKNRTWSITAAILF